MRLEFGQEVWVDLTLGREVSQQLAAEALVVICLSLRLSVLFNLIHCHVIILLWLVALVQTARGVFSLRASAPPLLPTPLRVMQLTTPVHILVLSVVLVTEPTLPLSLLLLHFCLVLTHLGP
jgi:hypothetical protein